MCKFSIIIRKLNWGGCLWMSKATQLMALYLEPDMLLARDFADIGPGYGLQWNDYFRDPLVFEFQNGTLSLISTAHEMRQERWEVRESRSLAGGNHVPAYQLCLSFTPNFSLFHQYYIYEYIIFMSIHTHTPFLLVHIVYLWM